LAGGITNSKSILLDDKSIDINIDNNPSVLVYDGIVIKYNSLREIEWVDIVGNGYNGSESIKLVSETNDGGYLVGGSYKSEISIGGRLLTRY